MGDHTVEAYSSCERTRVLYAVDFRSLLWTRILLLRKPSVWFAFFVMLLMCSDHLRSSDIVTLGILQMGHGTLSSTQPWRRYFVCRGCFAPGHMNDLAFGGFKAHVPELFPVF